MDEIYLELKQESKNFIPLKNIIDNVDKLLNIGSDEITFQKYQTQQERDRLQKEL